jgi:hypothetical protein
MTTHDNFAVTLTISCFTWDNYVSCFYDGDSHIDNDQCVVFKTTDLDGNKTKVELTLAAMRQFIVDMAWGTELFEGFYKQRCEWAHKNALDQYEAIIRNSDNNTEQGTQ